MEQMPKFLLLCISAGLFHDEYRLSGISLEGSLNDTSQVPVLLSRLLQKLVSAEEVALPKAEQTTRGGRCERKTAVLRRFEATKR